MVFDMPTVFDLMRAAHAEPRCAYLGGCALVAACADPRSAPPPLSCRTGLGFHQIRRPVLFWPPGRAACGVAPGARNGLRSPLAVMSLRNLEGTGPSLRGRRPAFALALLAVAAGGSLGTVLVVPYYFLTAENSDDALVY